MVDTATYPGVYLDGFCSLDEAIAAANSNSQADPSSGFCNANLSSPGATDGIEFEIGTGTPVINVTSPPPAITDKLGISGAGQASRVELHGPGSGSGLTISGAVAAGSAIRNLVLNNFSTAISISSTSNVTVAGNYFGTNAAGTGTIQNGTGISLSAASATIGGLNGLTSGGPCTGDCNLISGASLGGSPRGIDMRNSSSATIRGNFIGTDFSGMFPLPNGAGIYLDKSSATIGGTTAGAGNVISGNTTGIRVQTTVAMAQGSLIQGNFVGTNVLGTASIPNLGDGISVNIDNRDYPLTIGGAAAGNVISGNIGSGVTLFTADDVAVYGNFIGTQSDGTSPLPNGGPGVQLSSSTHSNVIGGIAAGEGNVVAFNATGGVVIGAFDYYNQIRGNSIHDNTGKGISLADNQDDNAFTPVITGVNPTTGTACANCTIDVYSDSADEGRQYEGTTTADGAGNWTYNSSVSGPNVTATATSANLSTSEFSAPFALPATPTPTPSPSPTPTPTPLATPTPTPTTTPTPTPTVTPTPTTTATSTHTATPTTTPTPAGTPSELTQGDVDCNGGVTSVDSLKELRFVAQMTYTQNEPCPDIGDDVASFWGDVDCNGSVTSVDALKILRFVAGLSVTQIGALPGYRGARVLSTGPTTWRCRSYFLYSLLARCYALCHFPAHGGQTNAVEAICRCRTRSEHAPVRDPRRDIDDGDSWRRSDRLSRDVQEHATGAGGIRDRDHGQYTGRRGHRTQWNLLVARGDQRYQHQRPLRGLPYGFQWRHGPH